ncbi:hypothetical protein [Archaeoglobus sp.]
MNDAIVAAIFTAITGQYLLLAKIYSALTKIKAEFKACPQHRLIFNNNGG